MRRIRESKDLLVTSTDSQWRTKPVVKGRMVASFDEI